MPAIACDSPAPLPKVHITLLLTHHALATAQVLQHLQRVEAAQGLALQNLRLLHGERRGFSFRKVGALYAVCSEASLLVPSC